MYMSWIENPHKFIGKIKYYSAQSTHTQPRNNTVIWLDWDRLSCIEDADKSKHL